MKLNEIFNRDRDPFREERGREDSYQQSQQRFKQREQSAGLEHEDEYERRKAAQPKSRRRHSMGSYRQYLNVPYNEREAAKKEGARWDPEKKQWYKVVPYGTQWDPFEYRHWIIPR